jgi:hypothetical protein
MRKSYLFMAMMLMALAGRAQTQDTTVTVNLPMPPRTDIGVFEAQTNVVIVKGVSLVNTINMGTGTLSVRSKETLNVSTGQKQYGMSLGFDENGGERQRAVVDYSELGSMLDGIDYLSRVTGDATDMTGFEAFYSTKSGFQVIAFSSRKQGVVQLYIQFDTGPRIELSSYQVTQFREMVHSVKTSLDALSAAK